MTGTARNAPAAPAHEPLLEVRGVKMQYKT
jgi:hypothetical protein